MHTPLPQNVAAWDGRAADPCPPQRLQPAGGESHSSEMRTAARVGKKETAPAAFGAGFAMGWSDILDFSRLLQLQ